MASSWQKLTPGQSASVAHAPHRPTSTLHRGAGSLQCSFEVHSTQVSAALQWVSPPQSSSVRHATQLPESPSQ